MQLTIEQIQTEMETVELAPRQLAGFKIYLAALYSLRASEMKAIEIRKARNWLDIRAEKNSAAEADRAWDTTDDGIREIELKWELRRIERLMSAISSQLRVMEQEARHIM